jgi:hypothetical protein
MHAVHNGVAITALVVTERLGIELVAGALAGWVRVCIGWPSGPASDEAPQVVRASVGRAALRRGPRDRARVVPRSNLVTSLATRHTSCRRSGRASGTCARRAPRPSRRARGTSWRGPRASSTSAATGTTTAGASRSAEVA